MLGFYNYTVVLTYIGMLSGFVGVTFAMRGDIRAALICLVISGLCDMFDGLIASTKKDRTAEEKLFGIQIDSLSDLICFGVLPASIVYAYCLGGGVSLYVSSIYVLCALIRLAWFNVDEAARQKDSGGCREIYKGLPVTTAALFLPVLLGGGVVLKLPMQKIMPWILLAMAIAFLTPFRMKKPRTAGKIIVLLLGIGGFVLVLLGGWA